MNDELKLAMGLAAIVFCSVILLAFLFNEYNKPIIKECEDFGGEFIDDGCVKNNTYYKMVLENDNCFLNCKYKIIGYGGN